MTWSLWSDSLISWVIPTGVFNNKNPMDYVEPEADSSDLIINELIQEWRKEKTERNFLQLYSQVDWNKENVHLFKKELELAQQIDPNNAWLDLVSVNIINQIEVDLDLTFSRGDDNVHSKYEKLWNNEKVQECLQVLRQSVQKTYCQSYDVGIANDSLDDLKVNLSTKNYMEFVLDNITLSYDPMKELLVFSSLITYHISILNPIEDIAEIEEYVHIMIRLVNLVRRDNNLLTTHISMALLSSLEEVMGHSIETYALDEDVRMKIDKLFAFSISL